MSEDTYDSEKWNMAMAYYQRLDNILTGCTEAQIKGNGKMWYQFLYRLYIEIQAKMINEEREKAFEMLK